MIVTPPADPPVPPADSAPPPAAPPVAEWPGWVKSIDAALLVLVLVTAFMVASHVARNHDQFLYYASGRALLSGEYSLGSDPFSFATAGRTWVNHSWLASVPAYLLYKADSTGFVIVVLKAVLFALTFGLLFLIRRAGQPVWPWVLATAGAVVASAPHTGLRPLVLSAFFLALFLYVLLGRDWTGGRRTNLIAVGVLSWLWAGCDGWFFLGPLAVLLTLIGEAGQRFLSRADDTTPSPVRGLAVALGVSVLAASLTPHHVRVWELPAELGFHLPADHKADLNLGDLTLSPLDHKGYMTREDRGNSLPGYAFALLLVGGGLVLAVAGNFAQMRVAHVLLWLAFAGLALVQYRAILFFSVAAVPLLALSLTSLIDRVRLGPAGGPRANFLLLLSRVGRIVAFPAALVLVAVAYPGKLHPKPRHPSLAQRVGWGVEPDPGLKRTAELLQDWRAAGKLPADYHGLIVNFDLANYVAWFAPQEKVFANGRYAFHRPEMDDLLQARRIFLRRSVTKPEPLEPLEVRNFREMCERNDLAYLVYSGLDFVFTPVSTEPLYQLSTFRLNFPLWHADGRAIVLGDPAAKVFRPDVFQALAFDPVRLAFRADTAAVPPPPEPVHHGPPAEETILDDYLNPPPRVPPLEAIDARIWHDIAQQHAQQHYEGRAGAWVLAAGAVGNPQAAVRALPGFQAGYRPSDVTLAYQILAYRAVWRAIKENPDYAGSYYALANMTAPGGPAVPGLPPRLRAAMHTAALCQYLERMPSPETISPADAIQAFALAYQLHEAYQPPSPDPKQPPPPQFPEPAARVLRLARQYLDRAAVTVVDAKEIDDRRKAIDARLQQLDAMVQQALDQYATRTRGQDAAAQARTAAGFRLLDEVLKQFNAALEAKTFGPQPEQLMLLAVGVNLALGKLDDAELLLSAAAEQMEEAQKKGGLQPVVVTQFQDFRTQLGYLRGNFGRLGEVLEQSTNLQPLSAGERAAVLAAVGKSSVDDFQDAVGFNPFLAAVAGNGIYAQLNVQFAVNKWSAASTFFMERALLLILEGKIDEAKVRLDQALRPDKIDLPKYLPQRELADQYLRMLGHAAK